MLKPKKIFIVTSVWGEYINNFIQFCLDSQLTHDNLYHLSQHFELTYVIYTDQEGQKILEKSTQFELASKIVSFQFVNIFSLKDNLSIPQEENFDARFTLVGLCHKDCVHNANKQDAALIVMYPDFVLVNNYYKILTNIIYKGKRVFFGSNINIVSEKFTKSYARHIQNREHLDKSNLSTILFESLHERDIKHLNLEGLDKSDKKLLWKIDENNFFQQTAMILPVYFWPEKKLDLPVYETIDNGHYIFLACPSRKLYCQPKKDAILLEFSSQNNLRFKEIGYLNTNNSHRYWLIRQLFFHRSFSDPVRVKLQFLYKTFHYSKQTPNFFNKIRAHLQILIHNTVFYFFYKLPFFITKLLFFRRYIEMEELQHKKKHEFPSYKEYLLGFKINSFEDLLTFIENSQSDVYTQVYFPHLYLFLKKYPLTARPSLKIIHKIFTEKQNPIIKFLEKHYLYQNILTLISEKFLNKDVEFLEDFIIKLNSADYKCVPNSALLKISKAILISLSILNSKKITELNLERFELQKPIEKVISYLQLEVQADASKYFRKIKALTPKSYIFIFHKAFQLQNNKVMRAENLKHLLSMIFNFEISAKQRLLLKTILPRFKKAFFKLNLRQFAAENDENSFNSLLSVTPKKFLAAALLSALRVSCKRGNNICISIFNEFKLKQIPKKYFIPYLENMNPQSKHFLLHKINSEKYKSRKLSRYIKTLSH